MYGFSVNTYQWSEFLLNNKILFTYTSDLYVILYLYLQQESGGTVLSTNWNEVAREKVEVKAPDGMEWRNWEQWGKFFVDAGIV